MQAAPSFSLHFDEFTETKYTPPADYTGGPITLGKYTTNPNSAPHPSLTKLDLTLFDVEDVDFESFPPYITKVCLKRMTQSTRFAPTVKEVYVGSIKKIYYIYSGAALLIDIQDRAILDSYESEEPLQFFSTDPALLLSANHPNYNAGPVTVEEEFGLVLAKRTFTRKPRLTPKDALRADFKILKEQSKTNLTAIKNGDAVCDPDPALFPSIVHDSSKAAWFNEQLTRVAEVYAEIQTDIRAGKFHKGTYFLAPQGQSYEQAGGFFKDYLPEEGFSHQKPSYCWDPLPKGLLYLPGPRIFNKC